MKIFYSGVSGRGVGKILDMNMSLMTMVSRQPRQIAGFDIAFDKSPQRIQAIVDGAPPAEKYCSDGWLGYIDVVYPGQYVRNTHD